jgi:succinate dehydrogenase hydrophobic anchor subunit
MMNSMMSGGMTIGITGTLHMALTGIVMIGLVGVFIYLVVTMRRA